MARAKIVLFVVRILLLTIIVSNSLFVTGVVGLTEMTIVQKLFRLSELVCLTLFFSGFFVFYLIRMKVEKAGNFEKVLEGVLSKIDKLEEWRLDYLKEKCTETWLTATPNNIYGIVLSAVESRDEIRDRYGLHILNTPSHCDSCNTKFSTTHTLDCKVGSIIHSRRDESHDSLGWLACAGFQPCNVRDEPHIKPCRDNGGKDESNKLTESRTGVQCEIDSDQSDLLIRGFWDRNTDCITDVRLCDVNQTSYLTHKPASIVKSAENEQKRSIWSPASNREETLLLLLYLVKVCLEKKRIYI